MMPLPYFFTEPKPDKPFENACVNSCVINNLIAFPTGALPKIKARNCLRDWHFVMEPTSGLEPETSALPLDNLLFITYLSVLIGYFGVP
jgi:hypothetical protein